MYTGKIPPEWELDATSSDSDIVSEGDKIRFEHIEEDIECVVTGVKEKSDRLDFLGEVRVDGEIVEDETVWLASDDFETVSHARDEIFEWAEEQMATFADY